MNKRVVPPEKAVMMEDHDKAYSAWKERGIRDRILVHVDAHIDFGWIPEMDLDEFASSCAGRKGGLLLNPFTTTRKKMVTIGNYICPAIRDGMVKKFYWVVPDASIRCARGRAHITRQLKQLLRIKSGAVDKPVFRDGRIHCRLLDRELVVCGLDTLERVDEPVLLDIDVDFMLTERIWDDLNPRRLPWIFPEQLLEKLSPKINDIDVLTIAYSVEGGYTPLRFKYLGDELRALFSGIQPAAMRHKRAALAYEKNNSPGKAREEYEQALRLDDKDASAYYNLSRLHLDADPVDEEKAARYHHEAVRRDGSYATNYNNYGILYLRYNQPGKAEAEYSKHLRLDGNNASVLNGLGYIALSRRRYAQADDFFDRCLAMDKAHTGARAGKAISAFKQGKFAEAEELFSGLKTDQPDDAGVYWWLGRLAERRGQIYPAVENYKSAVMLGGEGPAVHFILARLALTSGRYFRALEELGRAFQAWRVSW